MIKYVCDVCSREVGTLEAIGPGVLIQDPNGTRLGKEYEYYDDGTDNTHMTLSISVDKDGAEHFCLACMWRALERMMDVYAPKVVEDAKPTMTVEDIQQWNADLAALQLDATGLPKGVDFEIAEVVDEETDPGFEGSDTQLLELYAEGNLPTPGADERTDQEGGCVESDRGLEPGSPTIPNADDGPVAWTEGKERPGWKFHSTANGI